MCIFTHYVCKNIFIISNFPGFDMIEKSFYEDDGIDESCLQIECDNRKTQEALGRLSIDDKDQNGSIQVLANWSSKEWHHRWIPDDKLEARKKILW